MTKKPMEYSVIRYVKGICKTTSKVTASSPKEAALKKIDGTTHVVVIGKKEMRFDSSLRRLPDDPTTIAKIKYDTQRWAIVAMFDNVPEIYFYAYKDNRDKDFDKLCTISTYAAFASPEAGQTDTTASLGETKNTRSSSTSKKTSNGSVTIATWRDVLTRENTAKSSGTPKLDDTDTNTWSNGFKPYRSKQTRTLIGTILPLPKDEYVYPGINSTMKRMVGKTYEFTKSDLYQTTLYKANTYFFLKDWVNPNTIYAKVKNMPAGTKTLLPSGSTLAYKKVSADKVMKFVKCDCGCGMYKGSDQYYYSPDWLSFNGYGMQDIGKPSAPLYAKVVLHPQNASSVGEMKKMYGKVYRFTIIDGMYKSSNGYWWRKSWLEFVTPEQAEELKTLQIIEDVAKPIATFKNTKLVEYKKAKVITPKLGGKMSEMYGKVYRFEKAVTTNAWISENGYFFLKEWLDFDDVEEK